jgi:prepilin-type N-terminal cleavage/methylation domain-containing protein
MTRGDHRGFTLVELLVSMLILGVATPLLMGAIIGGIRISRQQSQDRSAATLWLQGEIEFLRRQCYANLAAGTWPRKVTNATLAGEPALPAVVEGRYATAPDAGYVEVVPDGAVKLRITVGYYKTDWGAGPPSSPVDASTTTYLSEMFTGRCP